MLAVKYVWSIFMLAVKYVWSCHTPHVQLYPDSGGVEGQGWQEDPHTCQEVRFFFFFFSVTDAAIEAWYG